jgi:ribonuclease D
VSNYLVIDSDEKLTTLLKNWQQEGVQTIALDFEGEFNLHIYGEHLCLIQIFDGKKFYIIDPFKLTKSSLPSLFENESLEKVMFDAKSDATLIFKKYQLRLKNVYDLRISTKLLKIEGSLNKVVASVLNTDVVEGKKANQKADWTKRPLSENLIEYALSDVEYLLKLKEVLDEKIEKANLKALHLRMQKDANEAKIRIKFGYENLGGYKFMTNAEKIYLKHFFNARDEVAKKYNLPPFKVLDKRILIKLAKEQSLKNQNINHKNRKIDQDLSSNLTKALVLAENELNS